MNTFGIKVIKILQFILSHKGVDLMFVAKSYKNLTRLSKPFEKNGKMYITLQMKSGLPKEVRAYTGEEYFKMYPDEKPKRTDGKPSKAKPWDKYYKPQKLTLGFDKGYITIFKGVNEEQEIWFRKSPCRYCRLWGWYLPSTIELPSNLPNNIKPVQLPWETIGDEEDWLIEDEKFIKEYVKKVLKEA